VHGAKKHSECLNETSTDLSIDILASVNDIRLPKSKQCSRQIIKESSINTNIKSKSDITTPNRTTLMVEETIDKADLNSQRIDKVIINGNFSLTCLGKSTRRA